MNDSKPWTIEEVDKLVSLSETTHYKKIAEELHRTPNAVYLKAYKMGITLIQDYRAWTNEEDQILKELWGTCKVEKIAEKLRREVSSVTARAYFIELDPMRLNNTDFILISDISRLFNVTDDMIRRKWKNKGLVIKKVYVSDKKYYSGVTLKNLMDFLEKNQEIWDSKDLEINILGEEPDWLKEKRKRDLNTKCNKSDYTIWTEEERNKAIFWIQKGKDYEFIAAKVNHTPKEVSGFLQREGYSYLLPQFWTMKEIKYVKENKDKLSVKEMASFLDRPVKSVSAMKSKLSYNIVVYQEHTWQDFEDQYLNCNYKKVPNYELANHLGICRECLIERLKFLGIYKRPNHSWTIEENTYIYQNYSQKTLKEMANYFDVTVDVLRRQIQFLGIYQNPREKKTEIYEVRKQLLIILKDLLEKRKDQNENLYEFKK